jgi:hypothetical protein
MQPLGCKSMGLNALEDGIELTTPVRRGRIAYD